MPELAEVLRRFGAAYRARYGPRLLPSHRAAMRAIEACRTPALGGHLWRCDNQGCRSERYAYHSCRNRSCPKCHREQTERWLTHQRARLPSCSYVLMTFTIPAELRRLARSHQRAVLGALCRSAAASVLTLCRDPAFLGATPAILAVLHTWTRAMVVYHPHAHLLVTLGGLDPHGRWVTPRDAEYLVPARALATVFRATMAEALHDARLLHEVPPAAWATPWVVDAQHAGSGEKVLSYLARYVFRVALTSSQIEAVDEDGITFRYRDRRSGTVKSMTLPPLVFIARFLQHVLPKGFAKVRNYGLLAPRNRAHLEAARAHIEAAEVSRAVAPLPLPPPSTHASMPARLPARVPQHASLHRCPACRVGTMRKVKTLPPRRGPP